MLKELEPLVAQFARSRETLFKSVARLDAVQVEECLPGRDWSVKDTLIHIATNEALMTDLLENILRGTQSALPDDFDNQRFNAEQVVIGSSKNVEQIRADLDASHARFIA